MHYIYWCVLQGMGRCTWAIALLAVLAAGLGVYYTINHLTFSTSRSALISSDVRLMSLQDQLNDQFGKYTDSILVVVKNDDKRLSIAFADRLAAELQKYPEEFVELFYRVDPEKFKQWALLYLSREDLLKLKEKLQDHEREMRDLAANPRLTGFFNGINDEITRSMIGELFTSFLEEKKGKEPLPDLGLLQGTLKQLDLSLAEDKPYRSPLASLFPGELGDLSLEGYFFTENEKYLLFLVTPPLDHYMLSARIVQHLREIIAGIRGDFPGLQAGVTGPKPLEDDEMTSATKDIGLATWLMLLGQTLLMILFFRGLRRPLTEGLVLIVGLCWTFGMATLLVGHLNLLSVIFVPLMLGLTIDYGIHWYCRLEEEQAGRGRCTGDNLVCTMRQATPAILLAALAGAVSFLPLVFAGFKGLAELGAILTVGVLLMTLATLVLLPILVSIIEKCGTTALAEECPGQPRPFLALRWQRPYLMVALGAAILGLGAFCVVHVPFDLNPLHLQNPKTESVQWEMRLLEGSRYSTAYGMLTAHSLEELKERTEALKKLPTVSHVESILSFLPEDAAAKAPLLQELAPIVGPVNFPAALPGYTDPGELADVLGRMRFKLSQAAEAEFKPEDRPLQQQLQEINGYLEKLLALLREGRPEVASRLRGFEEKFFADLKDKFALIKANLEAAAHPPTVQDLPPEVRKRFLSDQGTFLVQAFPSQDIWEPQPLAQFVDDLRKVDPDAVGDPVLLMSFTHAFRNACLWAAGMSLIAIIIMLVLLFRSLNMALLALIPLCVGTALTLVLMWLLKLPFNQANVMFLPLMLGEGVEFGIIILVRWKMEDSARAITLPASTAKGVLLAALTTTLGFGSLMISGHRGIFSLGLLATVGSLSVLAAALTILPALLRLVRRRYPEPEVQPHPAHGFRQWLGGLIKKEVQ